MRCIFTAVSVAGSPHGPCAAKPKARPSLAAGQLLPLQQQQLVLASDAITYYTPARPAGLPPILFWAAAQDTD